jgi:predicted  nucleic acid-binding Zn-ribbon protein
VIGQIVCTVYWFNPLAWLALGRLIQEQELACDREVLARGVRPSSYATHLLAIARGAGPRLAPTPTALGMARRGPLEERIMSILDPRQLHRVGRTIVLVVAGVMLGLIPALAAMQAGPASEATPAARREAVDSELRETVRELAEVEAEMAPDLDRLEAIEAEMEPILERIEGVADSIEPDPELMAAIEAEMERFEEQMETVEVDMAPYMARLEAIEAEMEPVLERLSDVELEMEPLHIELEKMVTENLTESLETLHARLEPLHEQLASLQLELEPFQKEMERVHLEMTPHVEIVKAIQASLAPHLARLEEMHGAMVPDQERLAELQRELEPFQNRMADVHRQMAPFHRRMEELHERLVTGLRREVRGILDEELGSVLSNQAPLDEAAARAVEALSINIGDGRLTVSGSAVEVAEILEDLLADSSRATTAVQLQAAVARAAEAIVSLEVEPAER